MSRPNEFSPQVKEEALRRQKNTCGSCGKRISQLGREGAESHRYGEIGHAHHLRHATNHGGSSSVENCVILCQSCHYCAHEGGNYRSGAVIAEEKDFPFFRG